MEPQQALIVLRQVGGAVNMANQLGTVHRDLAPQNIVFNENREPLLTGFGTAPLNLGIAVGTPGDLPPEQALGDESSREADVYSLGAIAFAMLTGTPPYGDASIPELLRSTVQDPIPSARARQPQLPANVDVVLGQALAKRPSDRFRSVLDLIDNLGALPWNRASSSSEGRATAITPAGASNFPAPSPPLLGDVEAQEAAFSAARLHSASA